MLACHATVRVAALLCGFLSASPLLAQTVAPPNPLSPPPQHGCFENSIDSKNAVKRLPPSFRSWLSEDAFYLITPDERCAFLHLQADEERGQFIERNRQSQFIPQLGPSVPVSPPFQFFLPTIDL
jgi:hypothetical protein